MSLLVPIALFGLIPLVFLFFAVMPPGRAMLASYLFAWLFLPMAGYQIVGLPDYTKTSATSVCVLVAGLLFGGASVMRFRLRWFDLPMVVYCLVPAASSLSNGLGIYDAASAALGQTVMWGLPYFSGRMFLAEPSAPRDTAIAIFVGGLLYVPLCLFEIKMSPQLHSWVYGYHQHSFLQTVRYGGWRPTVFMQHGLMVSVWMVSASLAGVWLWRTRSLRRLCGVQLGWLVAPLVATAILCKSVGALTLLVAGLTGLFAARRLRTGVVIWAMLLFPIFYIPTRALNLWSGEFLPRVMSVTGDVASGSLQFRLKHETLLAAQAMKRPVLGWAGWGRAEARDETGRSISVPDGLWILALGTTGFVGVSTLVASMLLPAFMFFRRVRPRDWSLPQHSGSAVLACLLVLYMIDCLFNAMVNPIFIVAAGCLASQSRPITETAPRPLAQRQTGPRPRVVQRSPV